MVRIYAPRTVDFRLLKDVPPARQYEMAGAMAMDIERYVGRDGILFCTLGWGVGQGDFKRLKPFFDRFLGSRSYKRFDLRVDDYPSREERDKQPHRRIFNESREILPYTGKGHDKVILLEDATGTASIVGGIIWLLDGAATTGIQKVYTAVVEDTEGYPHFAVRRLPIAKPITIAEFMSHQYEGTYGRLQDKLLQYIGKVERRQEGVPINQLRTENQPHTADFRSPIRRLVERIVLRKPPSAQDFVRNLHLML